MDSTACIIFVSMVKPIRVLAEIRSERRQKYAIIATFNGNLRFFERSVHRRLRAHQTLVLMDAGLYEQMMGGLTSGAGPRYAGVRYSVEPVYVKSGVFHPKFILTLSGDRAHLLLGSGNLGEAGYMRNAELFSKLEAVKMEGRPLDEAGLVVVEICSFLRRVANEEMVLGDGAKLLSSAVAEWADAEAEAISAVPRSTWLLHSLTQPILDQVAEKIGDQLVESITILSPISTTTLPFLITLWTASPAGMSTSVFSLGSVNWLLNERESGRGARTSSCTS